MNALTIDELYRDLGKLRKQGLGSKRILISQDDEGNGYHELFYSVNPNIREFFTGNRYDPLLPYGVDIDEIDDYVILG